MRLSDIITVMGTNFLVLQQYSEQGQPVIQMAKFCLEARW